jgi:FixJ family two-component response regulator
VTGKSNSRYTERASFVDSSDPSLRQILIVDDHEGMTRSLAWLFREAGYHPATFQLGLAALQHVRDSACKPVAAIVDIHLPDISGLILSQQLRAELGPATPIIVLSGDGSMEVLNSLPHVGATYFFQKPVSSTLLLQRIKEIAP